VPWVFGHEAASLAQISAKRFSLFECTKAEQEVFLEYRRNPADA